MKPIYFTSPGAFGAWLAEHHATEREVLVGYWRKGTGKPSLTWPESVDEALCWGWIDGVRRGVDEERFTIRFTPRKRTSNWSLVNVRKYEALLKQGRVQEPGRAAFAARREEKTGIYSFENKPKELPPEAIAALKRVKAALAFWEAQPPGYRRTIAFWIVSAKKEETRANRIARLVDVCARGERLL